MKGSETIGQFARFGSVGVLNTVVDYTLFVGCVYILGLSVVLSNVVSIGLASLNSFALNRAWTFGRDRSNDPIVAHALRFFLATLLMFAVSTAVVALLGEFFPAWLAKVLSIPPLMILSFTLLRRYVFQSMGAAAPMDRSGNL